MPAVGQRVRRVRRGSHTVAAARREVDGHLTNCIVNHREQPALLRLTGLTGFENGIPNPSAAGGFKILYKHRRISSLPRPADGSDGSDGKIKVTPGVRRKKIDSRK